MINSEDPELFAYSYHQVLSLVNCVYFEATIKLSEVLAKFELSFSPVYKRDSPLWSAPSLPMLIEVEMLEIPWYNVKRTFKDLGR